MDTAHRCPKCKVTIENGQTYCGNCKTQISWRRGEPRADVAQSIGRAGSSMMQLGCALTVLVVLVIIAFIACQ